ncbi:DUF2783 domain-containing protein [Paracoccus fistulariae]|uniref:DUF2783 domain-containing protein n=1 Tax=Paracoccus fistulariae TaxID=658446 RepID=A0ABY7SLS3_9RHOB|nr:DUF2783 domain-containing protein [Paracoccus fistulariae]MDB6180844.1 DUF2783 domain-containing protein [Paracoccus fistulariae]WCR06936.1 DUF2783 domain-containing protein [Paracoccus fistulariae]
MAQLIVSANLTGHDDIYEKLVAMHDGLTEGESLKLWSRLVLVLVNHIGDAEVIDQAIAIAAPGQGQK